MTEEKDRVKETKESQQETLDKLSIDSSEADTVKEGDDKKPADKSR